MSDTEVRMMRYTIEQLSTELQATRQYVSDIKSKLERTRKALEIAWDGLKRIKEPSAWGTLYQEQEIATEDLDESKTALEQKDVK